MEFKNVDVIGGRTIPTTRMWGDTDKMEMETRKLKQVGKDEFKLMRWHVGKGDTAHDVYVVEEIGTPGVRMQVEFCLSAKDQREKSRRAYAMSVDNYALEGITSFLGLGMVRRDKVDTYLPEMAIRDAARLYDAASWFWLYGLDEIKKLKMDK